MATWAADSGADVIEIAAVLGHRSKRAAEHYARGADRKRAAASAISKLERPRN
jgi:integrase